MSDDRTTRISWKSLFERAEGSGIDLAAVERELAARRSEDG
jgi:hypothetical protein